MHYLKLSEAALRVYGGKAVLDASRGGHEGIVRMLLRYDSRLGERIDSRLPRLDPDDSRNSRFILEYLPQKVPTFTLAFQYIRIR